MKILTGFFLLLLIFTNNCEKQNKPSEEKEKIPIIKEKNLFNAIDFPRGKDWYNTKEPLTLKKLKGKFLILNFFTYSNIDCINSFTELKRLNNKWDKELLIIGVHSPKYSHEKESRNVRDAVLKFDIDYPVVTDSNYYLWKSYGIQKWPSYVFINPEGKIFAKYSGENIYNIFDELITKNIKEFDLSNKINREPIDLLESLQDTFPETVLTFPDKILGSEEDNDFYLSDMNNHRILKIDFETKTVNEIIGNGEPGHKNGNYKTTKFFKPRGLYKKENFLYVADYGNHSIRRVDLKNKIVSTVAGTGKNSDDSAKEGNAPTSSLNYPLDITEIENKLYITQMGDNKIVTFDLNTGNLDIFAGNGEKNIKDGDPLFSSLAQPTGIVSKDKDLYFLDSDGNSLRRAETEYSGKIETLIGKSLFDYGDSDGSYNGTKLQFPMGIFLKEEKLYIADSFNNKIKEVDLTAKKVTSLKAYEKQKKFSWIKKEANFNEPSSILIKNGNAIISDTNNHSLQLLNLEKKEVSEYFLNFPVEIIEPFLKLKLDKIKETIEIPEETISITAPKIELNLELPKDYVWAENIPTFVKVESSNKNFLELKSSVQGSIQKFDGKISASIKTNLGESNLTWLIITHYYEEKKKIQLVKKIKINTRIKIRSGGKANPILKTTLPFKNVF